MQSSACIFGYDTCLQRGDLFLILDLGSGTIDISVMRDLQTQKLVYNDYPVVRLK